MMKLPFGNVRSEKIFKKLFLAIPFPLLAFFSNGMLARAGEASDSTTIRSFGLALSYTSTLVHTPEVDAVRGSRPIGITATYQRQFLDRKTWEHCGCYPRTGIMGGYFYLDDPGTLGNSYFLAGFAEPFIWAGKKVDLSLRGAFGATYMDTPYHPERNPENRAYSTKLSFFLQLGLHTHFRIDPKNTLRLSAIYDHASNGGVQKPNKGLNHPGIEIGYERSLTPTRFPDRDPAKRDGNEPQTRLDLTFYGGAKSIGTDHGNYYGFGGHAIKGALPLNPLHTLTLGAEWTVDAALKRELEARGIEADHQRGGIALGHEFLMGRFIFSQQLGAYFYDPSGLDDRIYHRWGLHYYWDSNWAVGVALKAHRHIADFIDLRITRSISSEQEAGNPVKEER